MSEGWQGGALVDDCEFVASALEAHSDGEWFGCTVVLLHLAFNVISP